MLIISSISTPSATLSLLPPPPSSAIIVTATTPPLNSFNPYFTPLPLLPLSPPPTTTTTTTRRKYCGVVTKAGEKQSVSSVVDDSAVGSAADVVRSFYGGVNAHDLDSVNDLIAPNCVYEDLVFPRPFVGRKEIIEFFKKFTNSTSTDLQFVIDDLSTHDDSSVGVIWHLEWKGKPFPFSKGCSFYRLELINGKRQITYGRDCVEPAIKPGDAVLGIIRSLTWLLQQFPQLADRF